MAQRAVESVLAQTYTPLEIILVEDGSRSGMEGWLAEKGMTGIRYCRHEKNKGLSAARNTGLRKARGGCVAFLDDDDEWLPDKLAKQMALFEAAAESIAVVYCGATIISPEKKPKRKRPRLRGDIRSAIRKKGLSTIPSTCLFRKQALESVGGYDEQLVSHVDHDVWMRLAYCQWGAAYVDECLVKIDHHRACKMTTDVEARLLATRQFCNKWRPELERWFSRREARQFLSRFKGQVMWMLGWACLEGGERRRAVKYFLRALSHSPLRRENYSGLALSLRRR